MHGVKRLFSWMIPRFDRERFNVSLLSLRKKDLSEETLDTLGIDITYLERGKFDPMTLPAMLRIVDAKRIDVLHLHGYGATTFGRLAGAMRGIPTIVHEHANLTSTPWFQKVADRLLEPSTDIALAVSKSTADFVIHARLIPESKVKVVYLGVPLEEFSRPRTAAEIQAARARAWGSLPTSSRSGPSRGCTSRKATRTWSTPPRASSRSGRRRGSSWSARDRCWATCRRRPSALGLGDRFVFAGFRRDVAANAVGVRPERVSVALGRHADHRVRGAGDGKADCRDRRRRPAGHPHGRSRRRHRAEAQRRRAGREDRLGHRSSGRARAPRRGGAASPVSSSTSTPSSARWSASTCCCTTSRERRIDAACCGRICRF